MEMGGFELQLKLRFSKGENL